jgi:hypothetical protein
VTAGSPSSIVVAVAAAPGWAPEMGALVSTSGIRRRRRALGPGLTSSRVTPAGGVVGHRRISAGGWPRRRKFRHRANSRRDSGPFARAVLERRHVQAERAAPPVVMGDARRRAGTEPRVALPLPSRFACARVPDHRWLAARRQRRATVAGRLPMEIVRDGR